jgi:hypothetical protein
MSDDSRPLPDTLAGYADGDADLQAFPDAFHQQFPHLRSPKARCGSDEFFAATDGVYAFVHSSNCIGRSLLCGLALHEDLMMIIGDALPKLMGFKHKRPIAPRLKEKGWVATTSAKIGHLRIHQTFGPLVSEAGRFKLSILYVVDSHVPNTN